MGALEYRRDPKRAHQMRVNGKTGDISYVDLIESGKSMGLTPPKVHWDHPDDQKRERGLYLVHERCRCEYEDGKNTV